MSRAKAIFITAVMAIMLAVILAGCYMIQTKAYTVLAALLAVYGFMEGARNLCGWLQKEQREPEHLTEGDVWEHDDERADYGPLFGRIAERHENRS